MVAWLAVFQSGGWAVRQAGAPSPISICHMFSRQLYHKLINTKGYVLVLWLAHQSHPWPEYLNINIKNWFEQKPSSLRNPMLQKTLLKKNTKWYCGGLKGVWFLFGCVGMTRCAFLMSRNEHHLSCCMSSLLPWWCKKGVYSIFKSWDHSDQGKENSPKTLLVTETSAIQPVLSQRGATPHRIEMPRCSQTHTGCYRYWCKAKTTAHTQDYH